MSNAQNQSAAQVRLRLWVAVWKKLIHPAFLGVKAACT
jgi:hypothetical protein